MTYAQSEYNESLEVFIDNEVINWDETIAIFDRDTNFEQITMFDRLFLYDQAFNMVRGNIRQMSFAQSMLAEKVARNAIEYANL